MNSNSASRATRYRSQPTYEGLKLAAVLNGVGASALCSQPTYEGLKRSRWRRCWPWLWRSQPTYEGLKPIRMNRLESLKISSQPTYEGLKLRDDRAAKQPVGVPSLPMRD